MISEPTEEDERYLKEQVLTYIGTKRHLLPFLAEGVRAVQQRLGKEKMCCYDAFSGSGIVSRFLKRFSSCLYSNDLEAYAAVLNRCYLANREEVSKADLPTLRRIFEQRLQEMWAPGILADDYAPQRDDAIAAGERVFYTHRNAVYLDTARRIIDTLPAETRPFFLAPLLYEASVHTNTSGVFKGFYKNEAGIGQFGGRAENALSRIKADIRLPLPVFSRFDCDCHVLQGDAAQSAAQLPELDLAYLDPPYNQHPYGSNYFMLNLLLEYQKPEKVSRISGIPTDWKRSAYNKRSSVRPALDALLCALPARFCLVSYNSEGYVTPQEMQELLSRHGRVTTLQQEYATFRGCRNLHARALHVREYLYILEKR